MYSQRRWRIPALRTKDGDLCPQPDIERRPMAEAIYAEQDIAREYQWIKSDIWYSRCKSVRRWKNRHRRLSVRRFRTLPLLPRNGKVRPILAARVGRGCGHRDRATGVARRFAGV